MNFDQHRKRHIELHRSLDELMQDFVHYTGRPLTITTVMDLAIWSRSQTIEPDNTVHDTGLEMPSHWDWRGDYAAYRPVGEVDFADVIDLCAAAIAFAGQQGTLRLLVDTTRLDFGMPSLLDRFEFAQRVSSAPQGKIKVVFMATREVIDPNRFGLDVAANRGFTTNIFSDEGEALAWLLDPSVV